MMPTPQTRRFRISLRTTAALAASAVVAVLRAGPAAAIPAFPGAEGFGAVATGGRGGDVIKVTNLNASGAGSLQAALSMNKPRIIVFDVSGVITGDVTVTYGNVTVAGQTAPGAGITIAGRLLGQYSASVGNIIIRHVRVRPPPKPGSIEGNQYDAAQFSRNGKVMLDHLTISWGLDECLDLYEADDVTFQWSTIEEAEVGGHPDGNEHNYGMLNGPDGFRISVHHNLFAHNKNRNPAIANGPAEVRNNVAYNVRHGFVHHNEATGGFNIVGNYYKQGPNDSLIPFFFDDAAGAGLSYYMKDNYIDDPGDRVGVVDNPWMTPYAHSSFSSLGRPESYRSATEHNVGMGVTGHVPVTTHGSMEAYRLVLDRAGAFPRDAVTGRIVGEVEARTGAWDSHRPANLLQGLTAGMPPADADRDGMADDWERANGLDPANGMDHKTVRPSGYTAIEDYINGLAAALVPGGGSMGGTDGGTTGADASGGGPDAATDHGLGADGGPGPDGSSPPRDGGSGGGGGRDSGGDRGGADGGGSAGGGLDAGGAGDGAGGDGGGGGCGACTAASARGAGTGVGQLGAALLLAGGMMFRTRNRHRARAAAR